MIGSEMRPSLDTNSNTASHTKGALPTTSIKNQDWRGWTKNTFEIYI